MKLRDLPIGSVVVEPNTKYYGEPIKWIKIAQNHYGMNETTLLTKNIITYKAFDAQEPRNPNSERKEYGNNRYKHSNLRQWLNGNKTNWYSAQHTYDQRPNSANVWSGYNAYDSEPGFLTNFSKEMVDAILPTNLKVTKPNAGGGGTETVNDNVFLLSSVEVGFSAESTGSDGKHIAFFNSNEDRIAIPTQKAKDNNESSGSPQHWWLRTPFASDLARVRSVRKYGDRTEYSARDGDLGVRPALNLQSSILVEEAGNGEYNIVFNRPPKISGKDIDLGEVADEIKYEYTVFDEDNDSISIVVRLNNRVIDTFNDVASGTKKEIHIDNETLYNLPIGQRNVLQIEARDEKGATSFRNIYFTRVNTAPIIQLITENDEGTIIKPFTSKFIITDPENDETDVKAIINELVLKGDSYERNQIYEEEIGRIELGKELQYSIPRKVFALLQIGKYELEIIAIDSQGGKSKEVIKFTRTEDTIDHLSNIQETEVMPKQIMIMPTIEGRPTNIRILACNNAYDEKPFWEDVTEEALNMMPYNFKNTEKTSDKWGIQARFIIDGKDEE